MDSLNLRTATELAALIRDAEVSAAEVVEAHLEQIAAVNEDLHSVVVLDPHALGRARDLDAELARGGTPGPLHGVPFTVKDWIEVAGLVCAAGFEERETFVPESDAVTVARLRNAGAVLLGKTVVNDGWGSHPRPNNPHDRLRTPGASSSGEAVTIAAHGSPLGLGSDSGGSIRWPAHCCGVAGLKPSTGRVPNTGHFPRIGHLSDRRTTIGPMARSARDLALVLPVIAGAAASDPGSVPVPLGDPGDVPLAGLRVAWYTEFDGVEPTPETAATVEAAARALAGHDCAVAQVSPPRLDESVRITQSYWARVESTSFSHWAPTGGSDLSADQIEQSTFEWERFERSMSLFMDDWDLVVSPAAPGPAPLHDGWTRDEYLYTLPYSLTRQPAVVVPFGWSSDGLPIGVQIAARLWRDDVALAAAIALEESRSS